jgi:hypothetical protein
MARYVVVAVVVVVVNQALPCGVPVFWTVIVAWSEQWWVRERERTQAHCRQRTTALVCYTRTAALSGGGWCQVCFNSIVGIE